MTEGANKYKKQKNYELLSKPMLAYGGELRKKAKNRKYRPLVFRSGTMHITLKSTKATGTASFLHPKNHNRVKKYLYDFSVKKGVKIISFANVGNHLHLHVKLTNLTLYKAWIRGLTSGLAMIAVGQAGFKKLKVNKNFNVNKNHAFKSKQKFWDHRPFSRVIQCFRHFLNTKAYIEVNILEGLGMPRTLAELMIFGSHIFLKSG